MSVHHGNDGIVKVGAASVAEVQSWTYDEEDVAPAEKTSMGDTTATPVASGCKRGKGQIVCLLDEADTTGQNALTVGASATLTLYPDGGDAGDTQYSGSVVVRTVGQATDKTDLNKRSFSFDGILTRSTVA